MGTSQEEASAEAFSKAADGDSTEDLCGRFDEHGRLSSCHAHGPSEDSQGRQALGEHVVQLGMLWGGEQ